MPAQRRPRSATRGRGPGAERESYRAGWLRRAAAAPARRRGRGGAVPELSWLAARFVRPSPRRCAFPSGRTAHREVRRPDPPAASAKHRLAGRRSRPPACRPGRFFIVFYQRFPQIFLHANFLYRIYLHILYIDYTKLAPFCQGEKRNIFSAVEKVYKKNYIRSRFFGCFTVILCVFRAVFCVIFAEKTRFSSLFCTFLRQNYSKIQEKRG